MLRVRVLVEVHSKFKLVVTVALKQEIDIAWLNSLNYPVVTLKALLAGDDSILKNSDKTILFILTGVGPDFSKKAAKYICDNLNPLSVINFGSCGYTGTQFQIGHLVSQEYYIPGSSGLSEKVDEIVEMEAMSQYEIFKTSTASFHVVKVITDRNDSNRDIDFQTNLPLVKVKFKDYFSYLTPTDYKISVIIPTFNRVSTLKRAINSVLKQTVKPLEIIIVDDGSTDKTPELLLDYGSLIKIIELVDNNGVSYARNRGVEVATGAWVSFLDSDDEWKKDKLKNQITYLKKYPFYNVIQSEETWIRNGAHLNQKKHHQKKDGWIFDISLLRCMIAPSSVMIKKEVFTVFGLFDEQLPVCEDYDLWLRLTRQLPIALDTSKSLVKYGGHSDQLSTSFDVMDKYRIIALEKCFSTEKDTALINKISSILRTKKEIVKNGLQKRIGVV
jgi:glycosyltransferase involved in cell wall biosynthesis